MQTISLIRTVALLLITIIFAGPSRAEPDPEALMENGHWKRAKILAEAFFEAHPQEARSAYLLSRVRTQFGEIDDALKYAQRAVQLEPKNAGYHLQLAQAYGDQAQKASILKQFGWARKCRAEIEAAMAIDPKGVDSMDAQASYYYDAPGILGGDKKKAVALARDMARINPARGYLAQAELVRKENGDDGQILQLYREAVESDPGSYDALIPLLNYYLHPRHTNLSLAEAYARQALQLNPDRIAGYCLLVQILVKQNRVKEVPDILHKAEAAIPDNLAPYVDAGRAMLQQGTDLETAESYLRKYLTQPPEPGWPIPASVHWSIGMVYEKRGNKARARDEMETALRLSPDFDPAKQELKQLK